MREIFHALVLDLHQPSGNLGHLLDTKEREAREILLSYERLASFLRSNSDLARVNAAFSGTLLETLAHSELQARVHGIVKCRDFLNESNTTGKAGGLIC